MRVFIAEKPSLAKAIFIGLGGDPLTEKKQGYFQHNQDVVTWCTGHMLELFDPEDYDPKYKKWNIDDLPITIQYPPKLKIKESTKHQFNTIRNLISQATSIVHACDPDEEGQLICDEILTFCRNTKPVQRLLVADLNLKPVQTALSSMQPNEHFIQQSESALARSLSDQAFGYNLTRGYTLKAREKGIQNTLNIGRVISAILGLVNSRTIANQHHTSSFYFDVFGSFNDISNAKYQTKESDNIDEKKRLVGELDAQLIAGSCKDSPATVIFAETKNLNTAAPFPFNLSALQQVCAKKFKFSASKTLKTCQSLYEIHQLITYPRSDNRYLSDAHLAQRELILTAISETDTSLTSAINACDTSLTHKAFDATRIEAHHAIIPTEKNGSTVTLSHDEKVIYQLIAQQFVGLFYSASERDKTRVVVDCNDHHFIATQSVMTEKGWETLLDSHDENDGIKGFDLRLINNNDQLQCVNTKVEKRKTTPPKFFVESTLLAAMTKAAKYVIDPDLKKQLEQKDKGKKDENGSIGTEATRAGLLEKVAGLSNLISLVTEKGYKEKVWKTTTMGQEFCALLPQEIIAPDISAIWAGRQAQIKKKELSITDFLLLTDRYISQQIDHVKVNGVNISVDITHCPTCKTGILISRKGTNGKFWACNQYPNCKSTFNDIDGKPNLIKEPPKPKKFEISTTEFCKECGKPLIRRAAKTEGRFWWSCTGYPQCTIRFFDSNGKPDRDKGAI